MKNKLNETGNNVENFFKIRFILILSYVIFLDSCIFGNKTIAIGEQFHIKENTHISCECRIPPLVTCKVIDM